MSNVEVYLAVGTTTRGPFTVEQLRAMWNAGEVGPGAKYWYRGMRSWKLAAEFQQPGAHGLPASEITLTTATQTARGDIEQELEIVTAECTLGMNILQDLVAGVSDIMGGRSQTVQQALRDARKMCLNELRREASALGADAVIAVDLDYSEISGQGKSMLFLVASGTAVRLKLPSTPPAPDLR
jgi:uncharacterized protein YbjQ (UPF0145 family)